MSDGVLIQCVRFFYLLQILSHIHFKRMPRLLFSPGLILKVISSKVLFFNITQKFTNLLVQLSIFLIDYLLGPIG